MQKPAYATEFQKILSYFSEHQIAVQMIKAIARGYCGNHKRSHYTWYEPLSDEEAIETNVHWILGIPKIFLNTVGDLQGLPKVLKAASRYKQRPSEECMNNVVKDMKIQTLFI